MEKNKKLKKSYVRELRNKETCSNYVSDEESVNFDELIDMSRTMWVEITSENIVDLQLNEDRAPCNKIISTRQLRPRKNISYVKRKNSASRKPSKDFLRVHQENHKDCNTSSLVATNYKDQDPQLSNNNLWGTQDGWNCHNSSYDVDISIEVARCEGSTSPLAMLNEDIHANNENETEGYMNLSGSLYQELHHHSTSPLSMLNEDIHANNENETKGYMNLSGSLYQELHHLPSFQCSICNAPFSVRECYFEHVKSCMDIGLNEDQETDTAKLSQPLKITSCFSLVEDGVINEDKMCTSVNGKSEQERINPDVAPSIQSDQTCMQNANAQQHQLLICPKEDVLKTSNSPISLPLTGHDEINHLMCPTVNGKSEQEWINPDVAQSIQSDQTCMQNADAQQHQLLICPKEDVLKTSNSPLSLPLVGHDEINHLMCPTVNGKSEQEWINPDVAPSMQNVDAQQHQLLICPKEDVLKTSNPPLSLPLVGNDEINQETISYPPNNLSHEPKRVASFKCPICDDTFTTKECYHHHLREVHVRDYGHGRVVSKENSVTNRRKQSQLETSNLPKRCSEVPEMTDSISDKTVESSLKEFPAENSGHISVEEVMQALIHSLVSGILQPPLSKISKTLLDQPANQNLIPLEREWKLDGNKEIRKKLIVKMLSTSKSFQNVMCNCPFCKAPHILKHLAEHLEVMHSDELYTSLGKIKLQNTQAISHTVMKEAPTLDTKASEENTTTRTPCSNQVLLHNNNSGKHKRVQKISLKQFNNFISPKNHTDKIKENSTNENKTKSSVGTILTTPTLIDLTNDDSDPEEFSETSSYFVCPKCECVVHLTKAHIYGFAILHATVQVKCPKCNIWHNLTVYKTISNVTNNAIHTGQKRKVST